ncbi:unnamed protein product, partial [Aphanomyces euteiches]
VTGLGLTTTKSQADWRTTKMNLKVPLGPSRIPTKRMPSSTRICYPRPVLWTEFNTPTATLLMRTRTHPSSKSWTNDGYLENPS